MTLCKYECMILSHDVSKILTACRMLQISIARVQGPAGRDFQLSGISGSGIAKNFGFGSGIGYICQKKYQSGILGY